MFRTGAHLSIVLRTNTYWGKIELTLETETMKRLEGLGAQQRDTVVGKNDLKGKGVRWGRRRQIRSHVLTFPKNPNSHSVTAMMM